jgi:hypothetical protein
MTENWLPVPEYDGLYEVSDLGRVRNVFARKGSLPNRILKGRVDKQGYIQVKLYEGGQVYHNKRVHILVAQAFLDLPFELLNLDSGRPEVNHKDLNKANNKASNLEWASSKENSQHAARMGKAAMGKLTLEQVIEIKRMLRFPRIYTHAEIASQFDVTRRQISNIHEGRAWSHVRAPSD